MAEALKSPYGNRPSSLEKPIPNAKNAAPTEAADLSALDAAFDSADLDAAFSEPEVPAEPEFESPAYTKYLPTVGGIIGGIAGASGGPATAIGGAALGGAAGASFRDLIETQVLGRKPSPKSGTLEGVVESAGDIAGAGALEGAGQAIGMGIAKLAGIAAQGAAKYISAPVKEYMSDTVKQVKNLIEEPLTKLIATKSTPLNTELAGDSAKQLLSQNIQNRYGPFIQAYEDIGNVAKAIPVQDEVRRGFTMKLKEWAASDLGGDNFKMVRKFSDAIDAAGNGKQIDDVIQQISDAKNMAYKNNAFNQAAVLKQLEQRAEDFMEGETLKLATKIQGGKASAEEAQFLATIAQQRGIPPTEAGNYAKVLAKDYLKGREKVDADYGVFRSFLEDVGEQTKVRVGKSPRAFMKSFNEVPSEKLIERMFDPKNAAALRAMQKQTPEVFDIVSKSKVSQLLQKSSPSGELDLQAFQKEIHKLPDSTRSILFGKEEMKTITDVVNNPRLKRINALSGLGNNLVAKWTQDIMTAAGVGVEALGGKSAPAGGVRQVVGDAALSPFIKRNAP